MAKLITNKTQRVRIASMLGLSAHRDRPDRAKNV